MQILKPFNFIVMPFYFISNIASCQNETREKCINPVLFQHERCSKYMFHIS